MGTWIYHRLYALSLLIATIFTMIDAKHLLSQYGNEAKYGSVCSDMREIVLVPSAWVCTIFASFYAVVQIAVRFFNKDTKKREEEYHRYFCEKYANLPFMDVEKWYWAFVIGR